MDVIYLAHQRFTKGQKIYCKVWYLIEDSRSSEMKEDNGEPGGFFEYVGMKARDLVVDPSSFAQFNGLKPLEQVSLAMTPDPRNPARNICTGVAA